MTDKTKTRAILQKAGAVLVNSITYLFLAVCILALVLSLMSKKNPDGGMNLFGKQMRVVLSDSMAKCDATDVSAYEIQDIPIRSMVFIELVPEDTTAREVFFKGIRVGDVLTFRYVYARQETITHRVVEIKEKSTGGYIITLEGDNKATEHQSTLKQVIDTSAIDSPNYIIGRVTGVNLPLGFAVTAVKSPVGIVSIIIIPAVIIAVFEIIRLINVLTAGKREEARRESLKKDEELEDMRRKLAILEAALSGVATDASPASDEKTSSATDGDSLGHTEASEETTEDAEEDSLYSEGIPAEATEEIQEEATEETTEEEK